MDRGAWWATVHGIAKNWTRLSTCSFERKKGREIWGPGCRGGGAGWGGSSQQAALSVQRRAPREVQLRPCNPPGTQTVWWVFSKITTESP